MVTGLYSSPPPAGQLCAAATSLPAAGVDAQSGGALLRHQKPCSWAAQLWLRAALDTSSTSVPLYVRRLWLFLAKGHFFVVVVFPRRCFFVPLWRAEAHCLWRSATVRCPITNRALRSRRHRALLCGAGIARRTPEGEEKTGISAERSFTELGFLTRNAAEPRIYHLQVIFVLFIFFCLSISSHRGKTRSFAPY